MPSSQQSVIAMIRRTQTGKGRAAATLFSVAGTRMVRRALRAGRPIHQVLYSPTYDQTTPDAAALLNQLREAGSQLVTAPESEIRQLTHGRVTGDIIALLPLPPPPDLTIHLTQTAQPLLVVAVNIQDPGNIGAMVRTAHAGGATLFVATGQSDPFHPEAVRTSMGSVFKLPLLNTTLEELLPALVAQRIETVAAATEGAPLPRHLFSQRGTALFLGNETTGLLPALVARLMPRVTIPMAAEIDSLSVNAATAIMLYEVQRQRRTIF